MAMSELGESQRGVNATSGKKKMWIVVSSACLTVVVIAGIAQVLFVLRNKRLKKSSMRELPERFYKYENQKEDLELPLFDFALIARATNNFSPNNKLGEGGFGSVYKLIEQRFLAMPT